MKRIIYFIFLLSFVSACAAPQSGPEPAVVSHTYIATDEHILNPERGFFTPYELPSPAGFSSVRITGNTLVHLNIYLNDYRESDIPEEVLNGLQVNFEDIREAGVKAIIRFAYNQGPFPDTEPDASKSQILRHIEQLTPLLQTNTDVIAWVEAGFIGAWGEWHSSTNGLDNITDKRDIVNAVIAAIPNRFVQVRYPANIIEMYPNPEDAAKARVAHHNDCFLSSNTDVGTYERDGVITIERDLAYLTELTRFTPMSGESCAPTPPRSECTSALQEMAYLHFSSINEAYHKGILRSWEEGGCIEEINNRMGYRFIMTNADFNERVRPGGFLDIKVNIDNIGFASIINERPLYVVLAGADETSTYKVKLEIDPRTWEPGSTALAVKLHVPSNVEEGEYRLALWLPDEYESLQDNPLYAIRFANENIWDEATGLNILGNLSVTKSAGGVSERGDEFTVISAESQTERDTLSFSPVLVSDETSVPIETPTSEPILTAGELISNVNIENDLENLSVGFDYLGDISSYNGFQVLIDIDQNLSTGLTIEGIGADLLLENDTVNSYSGSGADWVWTPSETKLVYSNENQVASWKLPLVMLNNSTNIDVVFQLVDTNWDTVFVTGEQTYTLK